MRRFNGREHIKVLFCNSLFYLLGQTKSGQRIRLMNDQDPSKSPRDYQGQSLFNKAFKKIAAPAERFLLLGIYLVVFLVGLALVLALVGGSLLFALDLKSWLEDREVLEPFVLLFLSVMLGYMAVKAWKKLGEILENISNNLPR